MNHPRCCVVVGLLVAGLVASAPSPAFAQVGTPITDGVFQSQVDLGTSPVANVVQGGVNLSAQKCAAILAGPRRVYALLNGDCVLPTVPEPVPEPNLLELVEDDGLVTITPEPSTLAMLVLPAGLVLLRLARRRRGQVLG